MSTRDHEAPRPYRGIESFRIQDRHLFFGRDAESSDVSAIVYASPISLLHASSGAGKTSLINAGLVPQLEDRGLICVVARAYFNPAASLIEETIARALPPPLLEAQALRRALDTIRHHGADIDGIGLRELRNQVNARISKRDPSYIEIRGPLRAAPGDIIPGAPVSATDEPEIDVTPFVVRFLCSAGRPILLAHQLNALARISGYDLHNQLCLKGSANDDLVDDLALVEADRIEAFLRDPKVVDAHKRLVGSIVAGSSDLKSVLDRLVGIWGSAHDGFALVLILDQFEELFTRFMGSAYGPRSGRRQSMDWSVRADYFKALGELVPRPTAWVRLPLQILISMRDDYIASIDELERYTRPIPPAARYHLKWLTIERSEEAIKKPAELFSMKYEKGVVRKLLEQLQQNKNEIEPSHLEIVCDRLYHEYGDNNSKSGGDILVLSDFLEKIGWVGGILEGYFDFFLNSCVDRTDPDAAELDRFEILHLLEELVTIGGRRNIKERDELVNAPFRDPVRRRVLLERMRQARVVRIESRLNGRYVEVTHDHLVHSIRKALSASRPLNADLSAIDTAIAKLGRIGRAGFRTRRAEEFGEADYEALWRYRSRLHLSPPPSDCERQLAPSTATEGEEKKSQPQAWPWVAEFMLRVAASLRKPKEHIGEWVSLFPMTDCSSGIRPEERMRERLESNGQLDRYELAELIAETASETLTDREVRLVLGSAIDNADQNLTAETAIWLQGKPNATT